MVPTLRHGQAGGCGAAALLAAILCAGASPAAAQGGGGSTRPEIRDDIAARLQALRNSLRPRPGGVLGIMGYGVVPDGSSSAVQIDSSTVAGQQGGDPSLTLTQFGFGFTVSEAFPLYLESYLAYARFDPRAVFTADGPSRLPLRWNSFTGTLGVGYDISLAQNLWLRPIVNFSAGYAAGDATLFAAFVAARRDIDLSALTDRDVKAFGLGGSLVLAYYDYRPERDIDVELRYTQIELETFGNTLPAARGTSTAQTLGLWTRYRWPTGWEAFGRPMRWVLDGTANWYLGDQRDTLGIGWAVNAGGGIEFDIGRSELGAFGITLNRVRLVGRYFFGDSNVTGYSVGIGMSF